MFANEFFNTVIKLPFANVAAFEKKMGELQKVAKKLGLEEIQVNFLYKIFEFRKVMIEGVIGYKEYEYTVYEVSGKGPVLNGWTLLGALDFDRGKDFPMVRTAPGLEVPSSYFETTSFCEHCNSQRFRKVVYVLQNEEGKTIQVGSSCLKDFVGHGEITEMVKYFTLIQSLPHFGFAEDERTTRFSINDLCLDKQFILKNLIKFVNRFGYISRKAIENGFNASLTTAEQLSYAYCSNYRVLSEDEKDNELIDLMWKEECSDEIIEQVESMLEFVNNLDSTSYSLNHNLKVLASASYWKLKDLSFVSAMYPACRTIFEKKEIEKKVKVVSEFLGYIGLKLELEVNILNVLRMESEWGRSYMYISKDSTGNIVVFYNKKSLGEKEETIKIKGKVKNHNLYRNEKQTILNYVKKV